jgi:hypothetical protein
VFNKPKMDRAKGAVKGEGKGKSKVANPESGGDTIGKSDPVGQKAGETPTVLDDYRDNKENGSKRVILEVLSDVADLHERVKKCVDTFLFSQSLNVIVASLYGADQHRPINMAGYILFLRPQFSVSQLFIGPIIPLPCDAPFANEIYRKALLCRGRYFILACYACNSRNTSHRSCSVSFSYVSAACHNLMCVISTDYHPHLTTSPQMRTMLWNSYPSVLHPG